MKIYTYLEKELDGGYDGIVKVAYSVIHKMCRHDPVMESHYKDIENEILCAWLEFEVDESKDTPQVIVYAQNKARHVIQQYTAYNKLVLHIPRNAKPDSSNQFSALEFSDIHYETRSDTNDDTSSLSWLKSAHYLTLNNTQAWEIWLLSEGFSYPQVGILLGYQKRTIYKHLTKIKESHAEVS